MKYNKLVHFITDDPHFLFENIECPYCEENQGDVYTKEHKCLSCGYQFLINENGVPSAYLDPLAAIGMKGCESKFLSEEISKIAQGKPGWKVVVATYHDPLKAQTFDIFWSMIGSNTLFKNGDRVDLDAASKASVSADKTNQTQYHYDPNMEQVETATEIKSLINKYNLDEAGYSVSSFVISPDGTKVFSGAPIEAFDSTDSTPFFSALEQCRALKASMAGRYTPDPDMDQERLQIAINNFIADDPMILSLPTGNQTPDEVGMLSDFTASQEENMGGLESMPMESVDILTEEWANRWTPTEDDMQLDTHGEELNPNYKNIDFSKPIWKYNINNQQVFVYGSPHTGDRMTNQRDLGKKVLPLDSPMRLSMTNIDDYVDSFVNYFFNIFPYEKNDKNRFLYTSNQYQFPLSVDIFPGRPPRIVVRSMYPRKEELGSFDYRIKNDQIVGGDKYNAPRKSKKTFKKQKKARLQSRENTPVETQPRALSKKAQKRELRKADKLAKRTSLVDQ